MGGHTQSMHHNIFIALGLWDSCDPVVLMGQGHHQSISSVSLIGRIQNELISGSKLKKTLPWATGYMVGPLKPLRWNHLNAWHGRTWVMGGR